MDIARPDLLEKKKKRRLVWAGVGATAVVLLTLGLSRLKPAAPTVERATVVIDTVKRGAMLRAGARPRARWCPRRSAGSRPPTEGRVERIVAAARRPTVKPDTVILELSEPRARAAGARRRVAAARRRGAAHRAQGAARRASCSTRRPRRRACRPSTSQARLRADADAELAKEGLIADIDAQALAGHGRRAREPRRASSRSAWRSPARRSRRSSRCSRPRSSSARAHRAAAPQPGRRAAGARRHRRRAPAGAGRGRPARDARARTSRAWRSPSKLKAVIRIAGDPGQGRRARPDGRRSTRATASSRAT